MLQFLSSFLSQLIETLLGARAPKKPGPNPPPQQTDEQRLLLSHNDFRRANGSRELAWSDKLGRCASSYAKKMADSGRLSHTLGGTNFADRIRLTGYALAAGGENIAAGYATVDAVMRGWQGSPGHRANMLRSAWRDVGFGVATDARGKRYWCAVFATPTTAQEYAPEPLLCEDDNQA